MELQFRGELWYWRGPAPFHFVSVPDEECGALEAASSLVSYGWGVIPARVRIGATTFRTALFPKDGGYVVPVKVDVRRREKLELGGTVTVQLTLAV